MSKTMGAYKKLTHVVGAEEEGKCVKEILRKNLHLSRGEISHAKGEEDGIMLNAKRVTVAHTVRRGDVVEIHLHETEDEEGKILPAKGDLSLLYEDEDFVCLNKPAGMVSHPSHGHFLDSLANYLAGYFEERGEHHRIRVVGRLDKETSGLILFAKSRLCARRLFEQAQDGSRKKEYLALCAGVFAEKEGIVTAKIRKVPEEKLLREVHPEGRDACTRYVVEEQKEGYALVRLTLETGRTHQIRIHMAQIGHPLLGDTLYYPSYQGQMKRAALHASLITMPHPFSGKPLRFEAPLPEDMKELL